MHHPTDRITHTTAFVTPVVEHWLGREIAQWVFIIENFTTEVFKANSAKSDISSYGPFCCNLLLFDLKAFCNAPVIQVFVSVCNAFYKQMFLIQLIILDHNRHLI